MKRLRVLGRRAERLLEEPLSVGVAALGPHQVGEVDERRDERRVQPQRGPERGLRVGGPAEPRVENARFTWDSGRSALTISDRDQLANARSSAAC